MVPKGRRDRVLLTAAFLLLISFALIPLAYQWIQFRQQEVRDDTETVFIQGLALARSGREREARDLFREMVTREELRDAGLTGLAYLRFKEGDPEEAAELCSRALQWNPDNRFARALKYQAREGGNPAEADQTLDALVREERSAGTLPPPPGEYGNTPSDPPRLPPGSATSPGQP